MRTQALHGGLLLCAASLAAACSSGAAPSNRDETFEIVNGQEVFRGSASPLAMSAAELSAYRSDHLYMRSLVPRGVPVHINHADPRQHRFVLLRLKMAGKTPDNSPQLFKMIDKLKASQEARGLAVGAVTAADQSGLVSQHNMNATSVTATPDGVRSEAQGSRKDALDHGYLDNASWDSQGNPLGDLHFAEIFGSMPFLSVQSTGSLAQARGPTLDGDSFLTETIAATQTLVESYVVGQILPAAPIAAGLGVPTVDHPRDQDRDGFTTLCLERTDVVGCEYPQPPRGGPGHMLIVPLKGSVSVTGTGVTIDSSTITSRYQTGLDPGGSIYVTLVSGVTGGGCSVGSDVHMTMKDFWSRVTWSPALNPTRLSWDLYNGGDSTTWAVFSKDCAVVRGKAYITLDLNVPYNNSTSGTSGILPTTITDAEFAAPLASPPNLQYGPPLRVTNSCLAAGTLVAAAGGTPRKIEDIQIGDHVANPYATSLTVVDTSIGTESTPMVHIADARGHALLLTEMHPLHVVDRGMVPARHLRVGDRVTTEDGTSVLVSVTRESYSGKVYNLKVGNAEEAHALGADQTAMFANGFLVGDSQIQTRYHLREIDRSDAPTQPRRLPVAWRTDYQNSLRRSGLR